MLNRVGEAVELIDNIQFLPFYRGVQIRLEKLGKPEEWAKMIAIAKTKDSPSRYFARLCKMVRDGTYKFVEAVKEVVTEKVKYLAQKLSGFGFGKYEQYWAKKAQEFINVNGDASFVELLEYCQRKGHSQRYIAKALKNCKSPKVYYEQNVIGGAK